MFSLKNVTRAALLSGAIANANANADGAATELTMGIEAASMSAAMMDAAKMPAAATTTSDAPRVIADAIASTNGEDGLKEGFEFDKTPAKDHGKGDIELKEFITKCKVGAESKFAGWDKELAEKCIATLKKLESKDHGKGDAELKEFITKCKAGAKNSFEGFDKAVALKCKELLKKMPADATALKGAEDFVGANAKDLLAKDTYSNAASKGVGKEAKEWGGKTGHTEEPAAVWPALLESQEADSDSDTESEADSKAKWLAGSVVALVAVVGGVLVAAGMYARNMVRATDEEEGEGEGEARVCTNDVYDSTA